MSTNAVAAVGQRAIESVAPQRTPVPVSDLRAAISRAYTRVTGQAPPANVLQSLSAQATLETGGGSAMYNFNFGGVKGASPHGQSASCLTHEVVNGKDTTVRQNFRAYASLDEGAEDYVRVMVQKFGGALACAAAGNLDGFAHALKAAGYYTASETDYASALKACSGEPTAQGNSALLPVPSWPVTFPSSIDVARLADALSASALKIAEPSSSG